MAFIFFPFFIALLPYYRAIRLYQIASRSRRCLLLSWRLCCPIDRQIWPSQTVSGSLEQRIPLYNVLDAVSYLSRAGFPS